MRTLVFAIIVCSGARPMRGGSRGRRLSSGGSLEYLEALKFRMLQIERPGCLVAGTPVRGCKLA